MSNYFVKLTFWRTKIQNIALLNDVMNFTKVALHSISADLEIPTNSSVDELAIKIWEKIKDNCQLQNRCLDQYVDRILCGRTYITWYRLYKGSSLSGTRCTIISNLGFNPFENLSGEVQPDFIYSHLYGGL